MAPQENSRAGSITVPANGDLQMLTVVQVADILQCSERDIRRKASNGTMPKPVKIGRHSRWPRNVIQEWIREGCPRVDGRRA